MDSSAMISGDVRFLGIVLENRLREIMEERNGVLAAETGVAVAVRILHDGSKFVDRQVLEALDLQILSDFLDRMRRSDQLRTPGRVNPVVAGESDGGGTNTQVHFG